MADIPIPFEDSSVSPEAIAEMLELIRCKHEIATIQELLEVHHIKIVEGEGVSDTIKRLLQSGRRTQ